MQTNNMNTKPIYKIRDALFDNRVIRTYLDKKRAEKYCNKSIYYWIYEDRLLVN